MLLDATKAEALKDAGMQLALDMGDEDWPALVLTEFAAWVAKRRALGLKDCLIEEFRAGAHNRPASAKAWGSLPKLACKAGFIRPALDADGNPVYRPTSAPATHRHPARVWKLGGVA